MGLQAGHIVSIVVYGLAMLALGWWSMRRITGTEGYFVGGRSIPGWAVGISMLGTAISSVTFLAYPGSAFAGDWSRLTPGFMLPLATLIAVWFFVVFYRRTMFVSAYEYFEHRFGAWGRTYASAMWSLMSMFRMGTILYLISVAIHGFTGWNILAIMIVTGILVTAYTMMGGLEAVIWTDVVQTIVLTAGGIVTVAMVFFGVPGGASEVLGKAMDASKFNLAISFDMDFARDTFWVLALMGLISNIQEFATDQTKIQRYAAAKSDGGALVATWTVGIGCIPLWMLFMLVGTCMWAFYDVFPNALAEGLQPDMVFPYFIMHQMPPLLGGIVIAAVLAAAMSSIDSSMNGTATVLVTDFYRRHFVKDRDDKHYLNVARGATTLLGVIMVIIAYALFAAGEGTILDTYITINSIVAGGLGGFFLVGFLFRRANSRGAMIGVIAGVLVIAWCMASGAGWITGPLAYGGHKFLIVVVGNVVVFCVGYLASLFFKAPPPEKIAGMTWWTREQTSPVEAKRD